MVLETSHGGIGVAGFEDAGRRQEPRNAGRLLQLRDEESDSPPRNLQKERGPANTFSLARGGLDWTSDLQNCR